MFRCLITVWGCVLVGEDSPVVSTLCWILKLTFFQCHSLFCTRQSELSDRACSCDYDFPVPNDLSSALDVHVGYVYPYLTFLIPTTNSVLMGTHSPSFPPLSPWLASTNLLSVSLNLPIPDILDKWNHTYMVFVTDIFGLTWIFSRFIHAVEYISNNEFCCQVLFYFFNVPHNIFAWVSCWMCGLFPTFWLLGIMLLWTFLYRFLCRHMFPLLLDIFLGVELLGHMVTLCLTFWGTAKLSSRAAAPFLHSHQQLNLVSIFHILTNTCYLSFSF